MRSEPCRLVFIDETSVKTDMTRLRGRAPCGARLTAAAPFGRWRTPTIIAGMTVDAFVGAWVIDGAMTGNALVA